MLKFMDGGAPAAGAEALILLAREMENCAYMLSAQGADFF